MRGGDQGGMGSVLKWGLIAGGAYLLYRNFTGTGGGFSLSDLVSAASVAPAALPAQPAAPAASGVRATAPAAPQTQNPPAQQFVYQSHNQTPAAASLAAELTAAAAGDAFLVNGAFNADHWAFYYNLIRTALTPTQFGAAFPGMTDTDRGPDITAGEFVARLQAAGLAGLDVKGLGALDDSMYVCVPVRSLAKRGPVVVWPTRRLDASGARAIPFPHRFPWGHLPIVGGR